MRSFLKGKLKFKFYLKLFILEFVGWDWGISIFRSFLYECEVGLFGVVLKFRRKLFKSLI